DGFKGSTLERIIECVYQNIVNENSWIDEETFIKILKQYIQDEKDFVAKNKLKRKLIGKSILDWINRKFKGLENTYTTLNLIEDLLNEFNLKQEELSVLFGKHPHFITAKKQIIRNPGHVNHNPDYKFSTEDLTILKNNLIEKFGEKDSIDYINKYIDTNMDIKEYSGQKYHSYHPNLNAHFFNVINNKIKAYWLGFLCADGYIGSFRYGRLGISLSIKDKNHLIKFCEAIRLDPAIIKEREENKEYKGKEVKYLSVYLDFTCKPMYEDLSLQNFKKFPKLDSHELYLAWLLGFYDGDGFQGKTMVCSASRRLLEQIKDYFKIKNNVRESNYEVGKVEEPNGQNNQSTIYILTLEARLFNKMMTNYGDSLGRKRKIYSEQFDTYGNLIEQVIDRKNFQNLVNKHQKCDLIKLLNTTEYALDKLIKEWNIKRTWNLSKN
ncbi:MAG: LAGLIDADG family homing endonuclease, partial [Promethearchaeota archaeon]